MTMTEDKNINKTTPQPEEQEIDLIELAQKVWAGRKLVFKVYWDCPVGRPCGSF